jgi:hypothetical protein
MQHLLVAYGGLVRFGSVSVSSVEICGSVRVGSVRSANTGFGRSLTTTEISNDSPISKPFLSLSPTSVLQLYISLPLLTRHVVCVCPVVHVAVHARLTKERMI